MAELKTVTLEIVSCAFWMLVKTFRSYLPASFSFTLFFSDNFTVKMWTPAGFKPGTSELKTSMM